MLERIIRKLHERGVLPAEDPDRYVAIFNHRANINVVLFDKRTGRRLLFLKISNIREFSGIFERLRNVHRIVEESVPEPVCCFALDGFQVMATRAYKLRLLGARPRLSHRKQKAVIDKVMGHLTRLHGETRRGETAFDPAYLDGTVAPMLETFFEVWRDEPSHRALLAHLGELAAQRRFTIPRIPQHGDLGGFNTALVDGKTDAVFIIDWDTYDDIDFAGLDAVVFVTSFARLYGRGPYAPSPIADYLARSAADYAKAVQLPDDALRDLYPLYWVLYASLRGGVGVVAGQKAAYEEVKRFLARRNELLLAR